MEPINTESITAPGAAAIDPERLERIVRDVFSVPEVIQDPSSAPKLRKFGSLIDELEAEARDRHLAKTEGKPFGAVTPWPTVTEQWGGSIPQGLHIILGGSGVGKTAFALQLAAGCQCPCLYVTCEMTPAELLRRTAARVTKTYLGKFKDGSLDPLVVRAKAEIAAEQCPDLSIMDATQVYASPAHLLDVAQALKKNHEHFLIVVDSLHSWAEGAPSTAGEYEQVSAATRELRTLAAKLGCPVIAISERNRASFGKGASADKIGSGAGSRKLEYGSESVLSLERSEDAGNGTGDVIIEATFAKNRNGKQGAMLELIFAGGFQNYSEK
jgi:replicative DNA helicase